MKAHWIAFILAVSVLFVSARSAIAVEDGKVLFTTNKCTTCHGDSGKGNEKMKGTVKGDMTKLDLTDNATTTKTDTELAKAISEGVKPMKAYKELNSDQVSELVKYIRTLQKASK